MQLTGRLAALGMVDQPVDQHMDLGSVLKPTYCCLLVFFPLSINRGLEPIFENHLVE